LKSELQLRPVQDPYKIKALCEPVGQRVSQWRDPIPHQSDGRRKPGNAQSHKFARTNVRPAVAEPTEVVLSFPSTAGVRLATCAGRFDFGQD